MLCCNLHYLKPTILFMQRTLQEYIDEFLFYLQKRDRSAHTIQTYRRGLDLFYLFFESNNILTLETPGVVGFKKFLIQQGASPRTVNTRLATLRRFINYLKDKEGFRFSKDLEFDLDSFDDEFLDYVLYRSDIDRLLRATKKFKDVRAEAIIATLAFTGVRVHELIQIPLSAIYQKSLRIKGKGGKYRTVFVPTLVRDAWKIYVEQRKNNSEFLFTGRQGGLSRRRIHDILKYYAGQARMKKDKIHAHAFRHFCGKYLHDVEGYSMSECMKVLGHKDPKTFLIYTRPTREEMEKKMQKSFQKTKRN